MPIICLSLISWSFYRTVRMFNHYNRITIKPKFRVERATKQLNKSNLWIHMWKGLLIASNFKHACQTDSSISSISLIKAICHPESVNFSSHATSYGCEHEKQAKEVYKEQTKQHEQFQMCDSGLLLSVSILL